MSIQDLEPDWALLYSHPPVMHMAPTQEWSGKQEVFELDLVSILVAQLVKNPPAMQETMVRFLGQEDPLEKGEATHSSILGRP